MKTRVTELLGVEYPIVQGGMAWVAEQHLAAAVSAAGGLGPVSYTHLIQQMLKKTAASGRFTFVRGGIVFSLLLLYRKITYNVKTYLCAASVSERTGSQVTAEELKRKKAVVLALMNDPMYKPCLLYTSACVLNK